jgi:demethylmenaquinone methyltransferase/2-methoxy-6-polyprenyl-1,4-benzoquinol methylase
MMTKKEIEKAVQQAKEIEKKYPEFYRMHTIIMELGNNIKDNEFDVTTISFGLRNTSNTLKALQESLRVLKPGGRMVVVEFSQPTNKIFRVIYMRYLMRALPPIARKVSSNPDAYVYLAESILAWPNQSGLAQLMTAAGFQNVQWRNLTFGIVAIHTGFKP